MCAPAAADLVSSVSLGAVKSISTDGYATQIGSSNSPNESAELVAAALGKANGHAATSCHAATRDPSCIPFSAQAPATLSSGTGASSTLPLASSSEWSALKQWQLQQFVSGGASGAPEQSSLHAQSSLAESQLQQQLRHLKHIEMAKRLEVQLYNQLRDRKQIDTVNSQLTAALQQLNTLQTQNMEQMRLIAHNESSVRVMYERAQSLLKERNQIASVCEQLMSDIDTMNGALSEEDPERFSHLLRDHGGVPEQTELPPLTELLQKARERDAAAAATTSNVISHHLGSSHETALGLLSSVATRNTSSNDASDNGSSDGGSGNFSRGSNTCTEETVRAHNTGKGSRRNGKSASDGDSNGDSSDKRSDGDSSDKRSDGDSAAMETNCVMHDSSNEVSSNGDASNDASSTGSRPQDSPKEDAVDCDVCEEPPQFGSSLKKESPPRETHSSQAANGDMLAQGKRKR